MLVFYGKADDDVLFSRISMVSVNEDSIDIHIHNERNENMQIFMHRLWSDREEYAGFDEEVFVDEGEEIQDHLSGFSSRLQSSADLSLEKIDTYYHAINVNLS